MQLSLTAARKLQGITDAQRSDWMQTGYRMIAEVCFPV
jgi:hypothetical protein